tara:strand:- start:287 stop:472 length:186 start_codon:yes stop_codon:yes gene_type:complete
MPRVSCLEMPKKTNQRVFVGLSERMIFDILCFTLPYEVPQVSQLESGMNGMLFLYFRKRLG